MPTWVWILMGLIILAGECGWLPGPKFSDLFSSKPNARGDAWKMLALVTVVLGGMYLLLHSDN